MVGLHCEKCGNLMSVNEKTCGVCGTPVDSLKIDINNKKVSDEISNSVICSGCGALIPHNAKFCRKCGTTLNKNDDKHQKFQLIKIIKASQANINNIENIETKESANRINKHSIPNKKQNSTLNIKEKASSFINSIANVLKNFINKISDILKSKNKYNNENNIVLKNQPQKKGFVLLDFILEASNPSILYLEETKIPWIFYMIFPALSYLFLFLQTGLDRADMGFIEPAGVFKTSVYGLILGCILFFFLSAVLFLIAYIFKKPIEFLKVLECVGIAHLLPLIINLSGFTFRFLTGWDTSVTFGLTGVMISLIPLLGFILNIYKNKITPVLINITALGIAIILGCNIVFFLHV